MLKRRTDDFHENKIMVRCICSGSERELKLEMSRMIVTKEKRMCIECKRGKF